jgi:hypothetical protein
MGHKLGVCVPYRNREAHLHEFIPKVSKYLKDQGIDFHMYFAHQTDDKLFNRGATKNIAAKHAFEDGCDYIVWHDIDMIPEEEGGCDYSYPTDAPRHIATQISQMDYQLKYHEYFGGAVLFTKEQVEATNGYSNNYWDWGMEDDDLFWRCYKEGLTNNTYLAEVNDQIILKFNGKTSKVKIPYQERFRGITRTSHSISVLVNAEQQLDKNDIFLLGSSERKYVEYPIFRLPGYDYGISFNNSRALTFQYWNSFNQHNYMWLKRYDKQWSWITAVVDADNKLSRFYLNGSEVDSKGGFGSPSPHTFIGKLKMYKDIDMFLGYTPSLSDDDPSNYFKGEIAKVFMWDRALTPEEVSTLHENLPEGNLINRREFEFEDVEETIETFKIPNSIIPYRVEGRMRCLPHPDEGIVNGKFVKGETTARNEKRYVMEMQQDKINYKSDGLNTLEYELCSIDQLTPFAKMINIKL